MHLDDEIASDDRFWPVNDTSRGGNSLQGSFRIGSLGDSTDLPLPAVCPADQIMLISRRSFQARAHFSWLCQTDTITKGLSGVRQFLRLETQPDAKVDSFDISGFDLPYRTSRSCGEWTRRVSTVHGVYVSDASRGTVFYTGQVSEMRDDSRR